MANRPVFRNKSPAVAVGRRIAGHSRTSIAGSRHAWYDSGRTRVDADEDFEDDNVSEADSDTEKTLMCERPSLCQEDTDEARQSFQRMSFASQRMSFISMASVSSVAPDIKRVGSFVPAKGNSKAASRYGTSDSDATSFSIVDRESFSGLVEDIFDPVRAEAGPGRGEEHLGRVMGHVSSSKSSSSGPCHAARPPPGAVVARPASLLRSSRTPAGGLPDNECLDEFVADYECRQQFVPSPGPRTGAMSRTPLNPFPATSRPGSTEPHAFPARSMEFCTAKVLVRGMPNSSNAAAAAAVGAPAKTTFRGASSPKDSRPSFSGAGCDVAGKLSFGTGCDPGAKLAPLFSGTGMTRDPWAQPCAASSDSVPPVESSSPASARMAAVAFGMPDAAGTQNSSAGSEQLDQPAAARVLATSVPTVPATRRTGSFRRTPPGKWPSS